MLLLSDMQTSKTSISVCVSVETVDCIKSILTSSKFIDKMNKEGMIIDDTSKLLRLAIVNLLNSETTQIKKSIIHANSDANLLKFLRNNIGVKQWVVYYNVLTAWSPSSNEHTIFLTRHTFGYFVKIAKIRRHTRTGMLRNSWHNEWRRYNWDVP